MGRLAPVVEVPPGALDPLAARWARPLADVPMPPLRDRAGPGHAGGLGRRGDADWPPRSSPASTPRRSAPAASSRPTRASPATGWPARSPPPSSAGCRSPATPAVRAQPRPARSSPGCGRRAGGAGRGRRAGRCRRRGHEAVLGAAARLGVAVPLAVWDAIGEALGADDHLARLQAALVADEPRPDRARHRPVPARPHGRRGRRRRGLGRHRLRGHGGAPVNARSGPRRDVRDTGSPHEVAGDRYELGDPLGHGRSTVYRATDPRLRRRRRHQAGASSRGPGGRRAGAGAGAARGPGLGAAEQPGLGGGLRRRRGGRAPSGW